MSMAMFSIFLSSVGISDEKTFFFLFFELFRNLFVLSENLNITDPSIFL